MPLQDWQDWYDYANTDWVDIEPEPEYEPEEDNIPTNREIGAQLPQEPGDGVWAYGDTFYGHWRAGTANREFYLQNCRHNRPQNMHGWTLGSHGANYVAFLVPYEQTADCVAKLKTFALANATFSDMWCLHRAEGYALPFKYVGQYIATVTNDANSQYRAISETRYDCPHCAYKAGMEWITQNPCRFTHAMPSLCHELQAIPVEYLPQGLEISGEPAPANTSTIKDVADAIPTACGNCGMVGHRSTGCTRAPKSFKKVGIEIEGRFLDLRALCRRADNADLTHNSDSSIRYSPDNERCEPNEFQTNPGSIREACQQLVDYYPDETDHSCGMHVHVSFDAIDVALFNTREFFTYFRKRWEEWGARMNLSPQSQFYRRLRGDNDFCRVNVDPVDYRNQDRYHQLNFGAWADHKTIECRMLPMFRRASLGVAAVQELLTIYEDFLNSEHLVMPQNTTTLTVPATLKHESKYELELVPMLEHKGARDMELYEVIPPAEGMVRIALPVNNPILLQTLAEAVRARRAA